MSNIPIPTAHITFVGALIALIFTVAMILIIRWLLAVPPLIPAIAAHAKRTVSAIRKIVVPTNMATNWERAVELACRLGEAQKAEIVLTYVIEIPFTLSLDATMTKAQKTGEEILKRAAEIVMNHQLPARTIIERARQAGEGIARLAKDEEADLIVVATPKAKRSMPGMTMRNIEMLLNRAPCEVIIDAVSYLNQLDEEPLITEQVSIEKRP
jgi:nucleotide-binding universal stress UspA family protein